MARPTRAGPLRHRVQIQARSGTGAENSYGEVTDVTDPWTTVATRWAQVQPTTGVEKFVASQSVQVSPETVFFVRMRYYAGLTPEHRLKWGSRILEIEMVLNMDELGHEHQLRCREVL